MAMTAYPIYSITIASITIITVLLYILLVLAVAHGQLLRNENPLHQNLNPIFITVQPSIDFGNH